MPRYKPAKHREGSKLRIIQARVSQETSETLDVLSRLDPPLTITEAVEEGIRLVAEQRIKREKPCPPG